MNKDLQKFFLSKPFAKLMIKMKPKGKNRQLILISFLEQHTKNKYTKNICLLNWPPTPGKKTKQKPKTKHKSKTPKPNQTTPKHQQQKSNPKLAQLSMKVNIFKKWV